MTTERKTQQAGRLRYNILNYLAHLTLSDHNDEMLVGGLMGDFLKGVDQPALPGGIREGIALHQAIDRFTDSHAAVRAARALIAPRFARFSGILIDVFFDHFLARDWPGLHEEPLAEFEDRVLGAVRRHARWLGPRLGAILPRMHSQRWLRGYAQIENIGHALAGLERRLKRPSGLSQALSELTCHEQPLHAAFKAFWPDVRRWVGARVQPGQEWPGAVALDTPNGAASEPAPSSPRS